MVDDKQKLMNTNNYVNDEVNVQIKILLENNFKKLYIFNNYKIKKY